MEGEPAGRARGLRSAGRHAAGSPSPAALLACTPSQRSPGAVPTVPNGQAVGQPRAEPPQHAGGLPAVGTPIAHQRASLLARASNMKGKCREIPARSQPSLESKWLLVKACAVRVRVGAHPLATQRAFPVVHEPPVTPNPPGASLAAGPRSPRAWPVDSFRGRSAGRLAGRRARRKRTHERRPVNTAHTAQPRAESLAAETTARGKPRRTARPRIGALCQSRHATLFVVALGRAARRCGLDQRTRAMRKRPGVGRYLPKGPTGARYHLRR